MTFSQEWDNAYRANTNLSIWPWSDVVSLVRRHFRDIGPGKKVLELGFGAGANIPFLLDCGVEYFGIEGSSAIVEAVRKKFPSLANQLVVGDFTEYTTSTRFDLILDRSSITHNDTGSILRCLRNCRTMVGEHGLFVGIDWFSKMHGASETGEAVDQFTQKNIPAGQFKGVGRVHFSDEPHLRTLFGETGFELIYLQHKQASTIIPESTEQFASWNLVAVPV